MSIQDIFHTLENISKISSVDYNINEESAGMEMLNIRKIGFDPRAVLFAKLMHGAVFVLMRIDPINRFYYKFITSPIALYPRYAMSINKIIGHLETAKLNGGYAYYSIDRIIYDYDDYFMDKLSED